MGDQVVLPDGRKAAAARHRSNVDSSRPFRSVKEAVAIFGERILVGEVYSAAARPFSFPIQETPLFAPTPHRDGSSRESSAAVALAESVKKLETELEETKAELKLLKDRESETEVALASLNAELHRNMSKMARAEAAAAAAKAADLAIVERRPSPSLAKVLSVVEEEDKLSLLVGRKKKKKKEVKKKPIIPLVGEFFFNKKRGSSSSSSSPSPSSSSTLHNPLYASSHLL